MDRVGDIAEACTSILRRWCALPSTSVFQVSASSKGSSGAPTPNRSAPVQSYQQRVRKLVKSNRGRLRGSEIAREFIDRSRQSLDALAAGLEANAFDEALELLVKAKTIYIAGVRRSFAPALLPGLRPAAHTQARHPGARSGRHVSRADQQYPQEMRWWRLASFPTEKDQCVRMARHNQAGALVITDSQLSPLARFASVLLLVKEGNAFGFRSLTNTMCLCQALFISLAYKLELNLEQTADDPSELP